MLLAYNSNLKIIFGRERLFKNKNVMGEGKPMLLMAVIIFGIKDQKRF